MPKVYAKKAGKDYPEIGVSRGETYYEWCFYRQKPRKSRTYPSRADLCPNENIAEMFRLYDAVTGEEDHSDVSDMAARLRELADDAQASYENLPEGLRGAEVGENLSNRADAYGLAADELDDLAVSMEAEASENEEWEESDPESRDGDEPPHDHSAEAIRERICETEPEV